MGGTNTNHAQSTFFSPPSLPSLLSDFNAMTHTPKRSTSIRTHMHTMERGLNPHHPHPTSPTHAPLLTKKTRFFNHCTATYLRAAAILTLLHVLCSASTSPPNRQFRTPPPPSTLCVTAPHRTVYTHIMTSLHMEQNKTNALQDFL